MFKKIPFYILFAGLELCLAAVGWFLGFLFLRADQWPTWFWTSELILEGVLYSLPPIALAFIFVSPWGQKIPGFKDTYKIFRHSSLYSFFVSSPPSHFALVSLCAGLGEEVLFRGFLQVKIGLVASAVIFGLFHFFNLTYFLVTTFMGLYLGWLFEKNEMNLLIPFFVHAVYDFVALLLMQRKLTKEVHRE